MRPWTVGATVFTLAICFGPLARGADLSFSKSERRIASHDFVVSVNNAERAGHQVWTAELVQRTHGRPDQTMATDSKACPAMLQAFARLQSIETFRIVPPGVHEGAKTVVVDGDDYRIQASGYWVQADRGGEIVLSGGDETPVARWIEDAMTVLAPCWRQQPPG